jgi:hypothetical protein
MLHHNEYMETEPTMELLEASESHISAPIRPYHRGIGRMRRDQAQNYLRAGH